MTTQIQKSALPDVTICVFGVGDSESHIGRFRVATALHRKRELESAGRHVTLAFFQGHPSPNSATSPSEAWVMANYAAELMDQLYPRGMEIHDNPSMITVTENCWKIVQDYIAVDEEVHVLADWPSLIKTFFLLLLQTKQRYRRPFSYTRKQVHLLPC